tara:strand:- start:950 stop:1702 length:753 start_codon:yes stop_codon:yes gene_type:complete
MGKNIAWLKEQIEWAFGLWIQIRPARTQRYAGYVILAGLGLLVLSFNDFAFDLILVRLGFSRDGLNAPTFGVILISIGFLAMLGDKLVDRYPSETRLQDRDLYNQIKTILPWTALDGMLNNLHNHWYWNEESSKADELIYFASDEANKFVDRRMKNVFQKYVAELHKLRRHMALKFFPEEGRVDRFLMLPDLSPDRTGQHNQRYAEAEATLNELVKAVENSYNKFIAAGRDRGMVDRQEQQPRVGGANGG